MRVTTEEAEEAVERAVLAALESPVSERDPAVFRAHFDGVDPLLGLKVGERWQDPSGQWYTYKGVRSDGGGGFRHVVQLDGTVRTVSTTVKVE